LIYAVVEQEQSKYGRFFLLTHAEVEMSSINPQLVPSVIGNNGPETRGKGEFDDVLFHSAKGETRKYPPHNSRVGGRGQ
jgi:hypothetical protein